MLRFLQFVQIVESLSSEFCGSHDSPELFTTSGVSLHGLPTFVTMEPQVSQADSAES